MFNRKGEISTMVILGTLILMSVAALMGTIVNNHRQVINTRAAGINCSNNPVSPPDGGYTWVANCAKSCSTNADCPQNTTDPSNVNPVTSNWCYEFAEGAKCLQLQKGSVTSQPPNTSPTSSPQNQNTAEKSICSVATGCGGACNSNFNQGCGYGGCREWEDCVNNTCIDTTNLGTQSAGENACHSLATVGAPENKLSNVTQPTPTIVPQSSASTTWWDDQVITPTPSQSNSDRTRGNVTPTTVACRPGQIKCLSGACVDFQDQCPSGPTPPPIKPNLNPNNRVTTAPVTGTPNPTTTPIKTNKVKLYQTIESPVCTGNFNIDNGCVDLYGVYNYQL